MIITKANAIISLLPTAEFVVYQNGNVEWIKTPSRELTDAEINNEIARLQAEYDANEYQRNRAAEYPSIVDQLDKIFHDGIDEWKETIQAVKDKYPKS